MFKIPSLGEQSVACEFLRFEGTPVDEQYSQRFYYAFNQQRQSRLYKDYVKTK